MRQLIFFALFTIILSSCGSSLRYFSQDIYDDYNWSPEELKSIQFYLSEDIVLWRKISDKDTKIEDGKVRIVDDRKVEEVIIKKNTPGVIAFVPKRNSFAVSFDNKNSNYLMFGPNPKNIDRYVLLAKDWDRRKGKVSYGDQIYETRSESALAALLIDIKKANRTKYNSKKAGGRKIGK